MQKLIVVVLLIFVAACTKNTPLQNNVCASILCEPIYGRANDWEFISEDSRTGKVTARTLTDCAKAFCDTIAKAGFDPMIYFGFNHSRNMLYLAELTDYKFWLAQYNTVLNYPYKIDMWQYTCTGSVPGINGNADINLPLKYD